MLTPVTALRKVAERCWHLLPHPRRPQFSASFRFTAAVQTWTDGEDTAQKDRFAAVAYAGACAVDDCNRYCSGRRRRNCTSEM